MNNHKNSGLPVVPLYYSVPLLAICVVALLILVFVFKIEVPVVSLAPPANAVNVSACGTLTQNNTYYVLDTNLSVSSTSCIIIVAHNSTFDGLGIYSISGTGFQAPAVTIYGNNNTIQGLKLESVYLGIDSRGNDTLIQNNYISGSTLGMTLLSSVNVSVRNNVIQNTIFTGISYSSITCSGRNSANGIYNNSISGTGASLISNGINFQNSGDCNVSSNTINLFGRSLYLVQSSNNEFANNLLENQSRGIYSSGSNYNNFVDNTIRNSAFDAIYLINSISSFLRTRVEGTNLSYYDLITLGNFNEVNLIDTSLAKYNLTNATIKFISSGIGGIGFYPKITASGNNLSSDVKIRDKFAEVNSLGFNKSAVVLFGNISTNLANPIILRNGVPCSPNICANVTLNAGTIFFDVTGWTNYSIGWSALVPPQMITITEPDPSENYSLNFFPVVFNLVLNQTGNAWFSLNNGATNFTMNSDDGLSFNYVQNSLPVGNYVFTAYANFTGTTQKSTASVNFSVGTPIVSPSGPFISIAEPNVNDVYSLNNFPVSFVATLSQPGNAWFSLNNGATNFTMVSSSSTNTYFTYSQSALAVNNYVFTAYANFTGTTQKSTASVNFSVNVSALPSANPFVNIEEPDMNEAYSVNNLPVLFIATLSQPGNAWFSLNNGATNFTMINSSSNNTYFTYSQNALVINNYTLRVYANFTGTTQNALDSVNFRIVNSTQSGGPSGPTANINEPSTNEIYSLSNFPVTFAVTLSQPGNAWFSLNNGATNFTMVASSTNTHFTYSQNALPVGNYNFTIYANFTGTTQKYKAVKNFQVLSTSSQPPLNLTSGLNNTPPNPIPPIKSKVEFKHVAYWLVVAVLAIAIVILILLIIKYFKTGAISANTPNSNIVSRLR